MTQSLSIIKLFSKRKGNKSKKTRRRSSEKSSYGPEPSERKKRPPSKNMHVTTAPATWNRSKPPSGRSRPTSSKRSRLWSLPGLSLRPTW